MRSLWTIAFLFCVLPYALTSSCKKHVIQDPAIIESNSTNYLTIDETNDDEIHSIVISNINMDCDSGIHHLMLSLITPFGEELLLQNFSQVSNDCNQNLSNSLLLCFNQQQGQELQCDYVNYAKNATTMLVCGCYNSYNADTLFRHSNLKIVWQSAMVNQPKAYGLSNLRTTEVLKQQYQMWA